MTAGYSFPSSRAAVIIKPLPRYQPVRHFSYGYVRYNQLQTENKPILNETNEAVANQPTSRIGKLIQQSKELVKFYKDGIKLLWSNHKEAKVLQLKVQNEGYELSRSEFQLIHRAQKDIIKLIPFGIIFCILPESVKKRKNDKIVSLILYCVDSLTCYLCTSHDPKHLFKG